MIPRAGQTIGPYEILGWLGSGGMGLVYSAWDARLERAVALKLLREEFCTPDMRHRFLGEARAASGLNHPGICTVFDLGEQDGDPFMVMELLRGETLQERLHAGTLTLEDILQVGTEVAAALDFAHAHGVIHRDIKPANVLLVDRPDGGFTTKVLDFGLAVVGSPSAGVHHGTAAPSDARTAGTVSYMSPEQARGELLDARSDLFSLGVVLYEMAAGQAPFRAPASELVLGRLLTEKPEAIRDLNPEIPRELERLILRLLEKDRSRRFASAAELATALARLTGAATAPPLGRWRMLSAAPPAGAAEASPPAHDPSAAMPAPAARASVAFLNAAAARKLAQERQRVARPGAPPGENLLRPVHRTAGGPSASRPEAAVLATAARTSEQALAKPAPPGSRATVFSIIACVAALAGWAFWPHRVPSIGEPPVALVLAPVTNASGDAALPGAVAAAVELALNASTRVFLRDTSALNAALRTRSLPPVAAASDAEIRRGAVLLNARGLVWLKIGQAGSAYTLNLRLEDAATGSRWAELSAQVLTRDGLPAAAADLGERVRIALGEDADLVEETSTELPRSATANVEALDAYHAGGKAMAEGRIFDAMLAWQHAVALAPVFPQAHVRLAELYRRERAGIAEAAEAEVAREEALAPGESERVPAHALVLLHAGGDPEGAHIELRRFLLLHPADAFAASQDALALRLAGRFHESLEVAQAGLARNPLDPDLTSALEFAALALGRTDAAAAAEAGAVRSGRPHPSVGVLIDYLRTGGANLNALPPPPSSANRLSAAQDGAAVLDAQGRLTEGLILWRSTAAQAALTPELLSSASEALATAALDRALLDQCAAALPLLSAVSNDPSGEDALFRTGLAAALCHAREQATAVIVRLSREHSQSLALQNAELPILRAALLLHEPSDNRLPGALRALEDVKTYPDAALATHVRGLLLLQHGQPRLASAVWGQSLSQRGAVAVALPMLVAAGELEDARALRQAGDPSGSREAYRRFLSLWSGADPEEAALAEAQSPKPNQ